MAMRKTLPVICLVLALSMVPAAQAGAPSRASVSVLDSRYSPAAVTISRGGIVTWTWRGRQWHNVYGSRLPRKGLGGRVSGRASLRFDYPGSYTYICSLHQNMRGTVRVR